MRKQYKSIILLSAIAWSLLRFDPAFADSRTSSQTPVILDLRANLLTPEVTKLIADVGVPRTLKVGASESLGSAIRRHCGRDDSNYLQYLKDKRGDLGIPHDQISTMFIFKKEQDITLPACIQTPDESVNASWGNPTDWAGWYMNKLKPSTITDFVSQYKNISSFDSNHTLPPVASLDNSTAHFGPVGTSGSTLGPAFWQTKYPKIDWSKYQAQSTAPKSDARLVASLQIKPELSATDAIKSLDDLIKEAAVKVTGPDNETGPHARKLQKGIRHLSVLDATEDECPTSNAPVSKFPVDTFALLKILGMNRGVQSPEEGVVLIIGDSGIHFHENSEIFPVDGFLKKLVRRDFSSMEPDETYVDKNHGMYVATAAVGGPHFMNFWKLMEFPFKIRVENIVSGKDCASVKIASSTGSPAHKQGCEIDDEKFKKLTFWASSNASIVNLSVGSDQPLASLKEELGKNRNTLFVVAAGNEKKPVPDNSFPARQGRHKHLIVVASLRPDGTFAKEHSSYDSDLVEIAAFGCRVPVFQFDGVDEGRKRPRYKMVNHSGTSLAAPLVSFAAALLRRQRSYEANELRKRLIVSADHVPELEGFVKNGNRLNLVRALSVFHDVVEFVDGDGKAAAVVGRITHGDGAIPLCGGQRTMGRGKLRSLTIFEKQSEDKKSKKKRVFFYYEPNGDPRDTTLDFKECNLDEINDQLPGERLSGLKITVNDAETGREHALAFSQINNITFADDPFWLK